MYYLQLDCEFFVVRDGQPDASCMLLLAKRQWLPEVLALRNVHIVCYEAPLHLGNIRL